MNDAEILDLLKKALLEVAPDRASEFNDVQMTNTIEDLQLDSIALMEMVGFLEDTLDVTFPDEALPTVNTLADLGALVRDHQ
ncbi:MAG: acyl carrier protein [Myxococcota bacterium]